MHPEKAVDLYSNSRGMQATAIPRRTSISRKEESLFKGPELLTIRDR